MISQAVAAETTGPQQIDFDTLQDEIVRLNKIVKVLMDRAERSATMQGSDFSIFQTTVLLEEQVRQRTAALEAALRENETITRALSESEIRFRGLVSQSLVGITIVEDNSVTYANETFGTMFGCETDEVIGSDPMDYFHPGDRQIVDESIRRQLSGEAKSIRHTVRGMRKDGNIIDVEIHGNVMEIGGKRALISILMDVTDRVRAEREVEALQQKLLEQAIRDPLTGLYNRRHFDQVVIGELARAARSGKPLSLLMADIDHFKAINDTYGHQAGDVVLQNFAASLRDAVRISDVVCRYGGEEFVVLMPEVDLNTARANAERIRATLRSAMPQGAGLPSAVTASFGISTYPAHGQDRDSLLRQADNALYLAKASGRDRVECATV
ncbi:sensor domain-containing diguanylate cyclase [Rhizobium sp. KAs_5_22]|uniref:sensor domain-containing diguanylate cyclase n=1 Tax=Ciceribacter selenitireducens TaxID=448181 RepID=UPI0004B2788C|nr:diguanylate cyclase [Ciceribacter selenitireducens]PPJ48886.1 sensor domain-containing diguanylate cyclase [Rhizobium sp. KAs_5_22]